MRLFQLRTENSVSGESPRLTISAIIFWVLDRGNCAHESEHAGKNYLQNIKILLGSIHSIFRQTAPTAQQVIS
jgi:hypothetical protein